MVHSYNCLRLDNKYIFQVDVYEDDNNQKFFELDDGEIPFEELKVGQLAELIAHKGKFGVSDILNLWQVNIDESVINPGSTEEDIKNLKDTVFMKRQNRFIDYFEKYKPTKENNINIVVVATTTTGKCLPTFYLSNKKFAVETMIYISSFINNIKYVF